MRILNPLTAMSVAACLILQESVGMDAQHQCPDSPTSAHHWMIDTPHGATASAVCKYCLADRRFTVGVHWGFDTTKYGDNYVVGKRRKEKVQ